MAYDNMVKSKITKTETFVQKEYFTEKELEETINKLLDKHFKVYNRLAEI